MPPTARAAFSVPSPSGPVRSTSRARLGNSAWCEKPSISAPAVRSISTTSERSVRIELAKPITLRQKDSGWARVARVGLDAASNAAAPARKPAATAR